MKKDKENKRKKWPWIVGAVALVAVILGVTAYNRAEEAKNKVIYKTYQLEVGEIQKSVTASGTLEAANTKEITLLNRLKVDEVLVSEGDAIKKDGALASLDTVVLSEQQTVLFAQLETLDRQLARLGSSTADTVYSTVKGRVKAVFVSKGDDVAQVVASKGCLFVISLDGKMKADITTDAKLALKSEVTVVLPDGSKQDGLVDAIAPGGYVITLDDDDPLPGDAVEVYAGEKLIGKGALSVNKPLSILSSAGTVDKIHVDVNDKVSVATKLLTLKDEPFSTAYRQVYDDRTDTAEKLETVTAYLQDPFVRADEDCIIGGIKVKDGQTLSASEMAPSDEQVAFVILTGGVTKLIVDMDELDIGQIETGQTASVTADAILGETFEGTVKNISRFGDAINGITTFKVEIALKGEPRLYAGMNAVATVNVAHVENIVLIPLELIEEDAKGEYVYITPGKKADGSDKQRVEITTGLSDGIYAQVLTGLASGDMVIYEDKGDQNIMMRMIERGRAFGMIR